VVVLAVAVHPDQMPVLMLDQQEQQDKVLPVVIRQVHLATILLAAAVELVA
jgi:hypothetical protein